MMQPPSALQTFTKLLHPGAQEKQHHPLSTLEEGQQFTQGCPPSQRLKLHFPLELLCSLPVPPPRTNSAAELWKSFLRALFPGSRSQRPPVATCQSQGLITCAELGAAHSSLASPSEMLTSGRWAPRRPGRQRGGDGGGGGRDPRAARGRATPPNRKRNRRSGEERVGAAPLCLGAGGTPEAGPDAGGSWCCTLETLLKKKN